MARRNHQHAGTSPVPLTGARLPARAARAGSARLPAAKTPGEQPSSIVSDADQDPVLLFTRACLGVPHLLPRKLLIYFCCELIVLVRRPQSETGRPGQYNLHEHLDHAQAHEPPAHKQSLHPGSPVVQVRLQRANDQERVHHDGHVDDKLDHLQPIADTLGSLWERSSSDPGHAPGQQPVLPASGAQAEECQPRAHDAEASQDCEAQDHLQKVLDI
mmetsp:Transcript_66919/g.173195  ORF Transcript_66919/g.173195 Transcript_66919/m.173195 type:complete len:216 (-) Transcript_66919:1161-1808(-)